MSWPYNFLRFFNAFVYDLLEASWGEMFFRCVLGARPLKKNGGVKGGRGPLIKKGVGALIPFTRLATLARQSRETGNKPRSDFEDSLRK